MNQVVYRELFESIKHDNLVAFSKLIHGKETISFGRFPLLSTCILFNAKKIIKKYKHKFLMIDKFRVVDEFYEIYLKFKDYANRTLRLYASEDCKVSPIEIYAIMNNDRQVKNIFKKLTISEEIVNNLRNIYFINNKKFKISGKNLIIKSAPLTRYEKRILSTAVITSAILLFLISFAYLIFGGIYGFGLKGNPFKVSSKEQFLKALNSNGDYILTNDISIDEFVSLNNFYGCFDGNNNTIYINKFNSNSFICNNNGAIKNLNIVYEEIDKDLTESLSLFVFNNNGEIKNINIECKNILLNCQKNTNSDIYINGFSKINNGKIENCSLYLNGEISTIGEGECFVGLFVGTNNGLVMNCQTKENSIISTISADIAGIVVNNESVGKIINCKNYTNISQKSEISGWSPNVSGICINNYGFIESCFNLALLKIESTYDEDENQGTIFLGGIACMNYGDIKKCLNNSDLEVKTKLLNVYCGGICAYSTYYLNNVMPTIKNCGENGKINIYPENESTFIFVGGISGYLYGEVSNCYSMASFENGYNAINYFVGTCIGASYLQYQIFSNVICLVANNNYVLYQLNAEYYIGCLLNNNVIVSTGINNENGGISTVMTEDEIKQSEVYWDES